MKTAEEHTKEILSLADNISLCEAAVRDLMLMYWKKGMEDAAKVCGKGLARANIYTKLTHPPML